MSQPKEQSKPTAAKRKYGSEQTNLPSKKLREEGAKHGGEPASPADKESFPPKQKIREYREAGSDSDVDDVPQATSLYRVSAESDGPMPMERHLEVAHASIPEQGDDGPAPSQEAPDSNIFKANESLRTLAANVSKHRVVRRMTHAYYLQFNRAANIRVSRAKIEKKQHQIQETQRRTEMEETPELVQALETLRDQHARTIVDLESTRADKRRFESPLNSLNAEHASRNNRLYDFNDVDKGDAQLRCLPAKF